MATFQYRVQRGETPASIAARNNLTAEQLTAANPGGSPFFTGQTIRIPSIGGRGGYGGAAYAHVAGAPQPIPQGSMGFSGQAVTGPQGKGAGGYQFSVANPKTNEVSPFAIGQAPAVTALYQKNLAAVNAAQNYKPTQYPANMPRSEQLRQEMKSPFGGSSSIGAPGLNTQGAKAQDYDYSTADLQMMISNGNVPAQVSPYIADFVNSQVAAAGLAPIYDANGMFVGGQDNGKGPAGSKFSNGSSTFVNTTMGGIRQVSGPHGPADYGSNGQKWHVENGVTYAGDKHNHGKWKESGTYARMKYGNRNSDASPNQYRVGLVRFNVGSG